MDLRKIINIFYYRIKFIQEKIEGLIYGVIEEASIHDHAEIRKTTIFSGSKFRMPQIRDIDGAEVAHAYLAGVPEAYVIEVTNGIIVCGREEIYTSDKKVIKEITSQKRNPFTHRSRRRLGSPIHLKGTTLCISLSGLERNYWHHNVELQARIYLAKVSALKYDHIDYQCDTDFQREFIEILGIEKHKILPAAFRGRAICSDILLVPSLINNWEYYEMSGGRMHHMLQHLPPWITRVHGDRRRANTSRTRIYISRARAGRRRVLNEEEVIGLVNQYGFRIFYLEEMSVDAQIELFNRGEIIIAPHGAGLVNMVYCPSNITLLEIFPHSYLDSSSRILARVFGFNYNCMVGANVVGSMNDPQEENIFVDCDRLERWLNISCGHR